MVNQDLLQKYRNQIVPGEKTVPELLEHLSQQLTLREVSAGEFDFILRESYLEKALRSARNRAGYRREELMPHYFRLERNENSERYYRYYQPIGRTPEEDVIFLICEEKTGCIESNCTRLVLEAQIARGIGEADLAAQNDSLTAYLGTLDVYHQLYPDGESRSDWKARVAE